MYRPVDFGRACGVAENDGYNLSEREQCACLAGADGEGDMDAMSILKSMTSVRGVEDTFGYKDSAPNRMEQAKRFLQERGGNDFGLFKKWYLASMSSYSKE